ncbi:hypothetical protein D3C72_1169110 [compost metagenome]
MYRAETTDTRRLQQCTAPQIGHGAIEIQILQETFGLLRARTQAWVERTAASQRQVSAPRQMQFTVADASGRPDRSDNGAGMGRSQQPQGIAHRSDHPRVAACFQGQIAPSQCAEAGEADHAGRRVLLGADGAVGAEVDPPAGCCGLDTLRRARTLPPQPVSHRST